MTTKLSLLVLLLLSGCGNVMLGLVASTFTPHHSTSSSQESTYHTRSLSVTQTYQADFVRKKTMYVYYDCDGNIKSSGYETSNTLSKKLTVDYWNRKSAWSYNIYNRTTKIGFTGLTNEGKFIVDHSPTFNHIKVNTGTNFIEYVFYKCSSPGQDPQSGFPKCLVPLEVEKEGIMEVNVSYSIELLPGQVDIHPSQETCSTKPVTE